MDVSQLNDKQRDALGKMREAVRDCQMKDSSDVFLLKWLTARNFDPVQAEKMLRTSLEWRRVNEVDTLLDTWQPPQVLIKYFPAGLIGTDKYGNPLWIDPSGRADVQGLLAAVGKKDYLKYLVYLFEMSNREMEKLSQLHGKPITAQTCVMDMEHLQLRQMTSKGAMEVATESSKIMESHYPESLRRIFIVNAPKIFTVVFSMFKPFMTQSTIDKFRIYGTDKEEWIKALLEDIDPHQLPKHWGGTMIDPDGDPMCSSKVCMGGEVPKSYYQSKPQVQGEMKVLSLAKRSKKQFEFHPEANSFLKWQFMTEDGDLGFRVFYLDGKQKVDVVPFNRVDCHTFMEEGRIVCTQTTKYVFEFDNSYSWVRSKTVSYTIELEPQMNEPANEIEERSAEIPLEDPTENLPESSTENPPEDSTENLPEGSTENPPEDYTENLPEGSTENPPEDSTENPPEDSTENLPEGSIENPPEDPNENPPEDSTKNTTKDSTKNSIESPISE